MHAHIVHSCSHFFSCSSVVRNLRKTITEGKKNQIQNPIANRYFEKPYAVQEAIVRTGHGTTDWFQIGKGVRQAVYCHPAYFTYMQRTS